MLTEQDLPDCLIFLFCLEHINDSDINPQLRDFLIDYKMSVVEYEQQIKGKPGLETIFECLICQLEKRLHISQELLTHLQAAHVECDWKDD